MENMSNMEEMNMCQSCGMPMKDNADLYGTNADGTKNKEYCTYCYQEGKFTTEQTLKEMIDTCVPFMVEDNPSLTPEEARANLNAFLPTLKRWQAE